MNNQWFQALLVRIACGAITGFLAGSLTAGAAPKAPGTPSASPTIPPEVFRLIDAKEDQLKDFARRLHLEPGDNVWDFFDTLREERWPAIEAAYRDLNADRGRGDGDRADPETRGMVRGPILESMLAYEVFALGERRYLEAFARGVLGAIPPGSLYFGGSDPARALVTAFSKSHQGADPCFTMTHNALADGSYLQYVRAMYGDRLQLPTAADSSRAFSTYLAGAQKRLEHDQSHPNEPAQLLPGEEVHLVDHRLQVSGQVAVMTINGLLLKEIMERNPDRPVFLEQNQPIEWLFPHLEPEGFILKVSRAPMKSIRAETVARDEAYWQPHLEAALGGLLKSEATTARICDVVGKVFVDHRYEGFTGDRRYVGNDLTRRFYAGLRASIASVYAWHATHDELPEDRRRMADAARRAYREAFALDPGFPEAALGLVKLLSEAGLQSEAVLVAETAARVAPSQGTFRDLVSRLKQADRGPGR